MRFWVYMLLCNNQSLYTGYTRDLRARYRSHRDGTGGCKYTRSFKPVALCQCWRITGGKAIAMRMEQRIKKMSRSEKDSVILQPDLMQMDPGIRCVSADRLKKIKGCLNNDFMDLQK